MPLQVFNNYEDSADYVKLFPNVDKELREKPISLGYPGALFPIGFCLMVIWLILLYRSWFCPLRRFPVIRWRIRYAEFHASDGLP